MSEVISKEEKDLIKKLARERLYKCQKSCYGKSYPNYNFAEGDYGTWKQWENVLVGFAIKIKTMDNGR